MINLNYMNFKKEVLNSDLPVVIGCYLADDVSERMMILLKALSKKYDKKVKFVKLNATEYGKIVEQYDVTQMPTLLFFHEGKEFDRVVGAMPKTVLEVQLNMVLERLYSKMVRKVK